MNKRGQALVEFVLILPVLLLIIFSLFDVGRIILCKNHLENELNEVVILVRENKENEIKNYLKQDEYKIEYSIKKNKYTNIKLSTKLNLITPGLNKILDSNVNVERSIINE